MKKSELVIAIIAILIGIAGMVAVIANMIANV
jgi:hypothetical protein